MRAAQLSFRTFWILLCLLGALLFSPSLFGQSSSQQMEAIRQRMEDGLALFTGGKPLEAAKVFEEGYAQHPYSAFLFNAGICYEKVGQNEQALAKYKEYMRVDPNSPDIAEVRRRVAKLEALLGQGEPLDPNAPPPPPPPPDEVGEESMRSLVVVESEPSGAPVLVFRPTSESSPPFKLGEENPTWTQVVTTTAPTSLSLSVGRYQIVVDSFKEFNASDTELRVSPGHVHHFKANLSQGAFMAFLRVSGNVKGAHLYLDDPAKTKPEWGTTPYGELVPVGEHEVLVEAPGFQPLTTKVTLESGERREVEVTLARVNYGFVRVEADVKEIEVSLDGKPRGRWRQGEPPLDVRAEAGTHRLSVYAEDRKDFEADIVIPKGQVLPVRVTMIPKYPRGTAWTQAIIGGVAVGAGIYLGLESERLKDELQTERERGVLEADDSRISKGRWFAVGADAGFAAGIVLGGLATWNFIKDPLPESSHEEAPPVEFDDPLKTPRVASSGPTRRLTPRRIPSHPSPRPESEPASAPWTIAPLAGPNVAGIGFGGSF